MKKILALLLATLMLATCFACASSEPEAAAQPAAEPAAPAAEEAPVDAEPAETEATGEKRVVNVFTKKREWDWETIEKRYEAYNPQVDLVVDATDANTYYDLLKGYLASGDLPDVIQITSGSTMDVWKEHLVALDGMEALTTMPEASTAEFMADGAYYGIPLFAELHGVIYNMTYLNAAGWTTTPTTLDEFIKLNEDLIAAGQPTGICSYSNAGAILGHMTAPVFSSHEDAYAYQAEIVAGNADLTADAGWNALYDYLEATIKYGNPDALVTDNTTERNALYAEEYAWYAHDGSWLTPQIKATNPALEDHIALGVYPFTNDAASNKIGNSLQGMSVMNTEHAEDAKNFVNWLLGTDDGCDVLANVCNVVLLKDGFELTTESVGALGVQGMNYVAAGQAYNNFRGFPTEIQSTLMAAIQKFLAGTSTRAESLAEIQALFESTK